MACKAVNAGPFSLPHCSSRQPEPQPRSLHRYVSCQRNAAAKTQGCVQHAGVIITAGCEALQTHRAHQAVHTSNHFERPVHSQLAKTRNETAAEAKARTFVLENGSKTLRLFRVYHI